MIKRFSIPTVFALLMIVIACNGQDTDKEITETPTELPGPVVLKKAEPHRYGGWYCPDNFGFVPVDIQKLDEVPVIADRLPTQQELRDNKSLISVDTVKYPDARALKMELPRVARIYSQSNGMNELVIVIQAIIVSEDTVVGYRFPNGGNGSAWMRDVTFLSDDEVAVFGSQPFFYSKSDLNNSKEDIWKAITETDYFKQLGKKFDNQEFFSSDWTPASEAHLNSVSEQEQATGYVGTLFGNVYMQIDYNRDGFHYSEKLLMIEDLEQQTTELFFASGPYPDDYEKQKSNWENWLENIKKTVETD